MPFCRECGKEVQGDWVTCPYCRASFGTRHQNRSLWNIVIIASTVLILLWPTGIGDLSINDRAFFDCNDDLFVILDLEDSCQDWRGDGRFILVLVLSIFATLLLINNRTSMDTKYTVDNRNELKQKRIKAKQFHLEQNRKAMKLAAEKRSIELENIATEKGFKSVKEMQKYQRDSVRKISINVLVTAIVFTIAFYPYIDTHNVDSLGWYVEDTTVSLHEVATCSTYEKIETMYYSVGDSEVLDIYCPSESYRDEFRIPYFLMIIGFIVMMGAMNWKTLSGLFEKKSNNNPITTEEE
ncbi:MAG: hypothetical protein CMB01_01700 [Euryarchaeota archaeon]|nr:hypothetical protein [Euryarchaeota archaeon]